MRHTLPLLIAVFLLGYASPVQASGQLIPPVGNVSGNCPDNQVLAWVGNNLKCKNPTPGISVSPPCPAGEGYQKIVGGEGICIKTEAPTVSCFDDNAIRKIENGVVTCVDIEDTANITASCGAGEAIQKLVGDTTVCVDVDGNSTMASCGAGEAIQKIENGVVTCAEVGTAGSTLTASCPSGQVLQKVVNGVPTCVDFATEVSVDVSCSTREVIKGVMADGRPICVIRTPWINGFFTVDGTSTSSPCLIPDGSTGQCKCKMGTFPIKSLELGNTTQFTCYAWTRFN